jgi:sialic acid synthase SpsE
MFKIKIGNAMLGDNEHCFTIAEAGANHDAEVN